MSSTQKIDRVIVVVLIAIILIAGYRAFGVGIIECLRGIVNHMCS